MMTFLCFVAGVPHDFVSMWDLTDDLLKKDMVMVVLYLYKDDLNLFDFHNVLLVLVG